MTVSSSITCSRGQADNLQVVYLSRNPDNLSAEGYACLLWQDNRTGTWYEGEKFLCAEQLGAISSERGSGDVLHLVGLTRRDGVPLLISQDQPDGTWSCSHSLPSDGHVFSALALGHGDRNNLQVVLVDRDDGLPYLIWQASGNRSWNWYGRLPGNVAFESVAMFRGNADNLQVIGIGRDDHLPYLIWQDNQTGSWYWYGRLPGNVAFESVAMARGDRNNLQVVGIGRDDHLPYLIWQASGNGAWNWYGRLPGAVELAAVTIGRGNADNLQVAGIGRADHQPYLIWQDNKTGTWYWYGKLPHTGIQLSTHLAAARGDRNNLQVLALETADVGPHLLWQASGDGSWHPLDLSRQLDSKLRNLLARDFNPCDINRDGIAEIESARVLDLGPRVTMHDPTRRLVLVLVESRLLDNIPGARYSREDLQARLLTYTSDLWREGFDPVLVLVKPHARQPAQDGRTVIALRRLFQRVRAMYGNFAGSVLVGSFPDARVTWFWPEHIKDQRRYSEGGFFVTLPRYDIVLADLDGNWEACYHADVTVNGYAFYLTNASTEQRTGDWVKLTNTKKVLEGSVPLHDTFYIRDAKFTVSPPHPDGTVDVDFRLLATDPEVSPADGVNPNPIARPDIAVSRINARSIAVNPPAVAHALDANGKPQEATRWFAAEQWERIPDLERRLLIDYFDRNHAFRAGQFAAQGERVALVECGLGTYAAQHALDGWNPTRQDTPNASLLEFTRWLKQPATFRLIAAHADRGSTFFRQADQEALQVESEAGGHPWRWIVTDGKVVPSFGGHFTGDLYLYRTLWENGVLRGTCPSLMIHLGCDVNGVATERPYDDLSFGPFQNAESLLFYGNQLSVLCHIHWWYDGPTGFGQAMTRTPNATMGDGWRGFFEHWSSDGTLRSIDQQADRKRPYEWSIVGDWTLRRYYLKPS